MDFVKPTSVDLLTEVIGYLFQAAGSFFFGMALRYRKTWSLKNIFIGSVAIDFISILLASLSHSIITVLLFGCLMNFFHGIIAGFYLFLLATKVTRQYRSLVFLGAYALANVASWFLSLPTIQNSLRPDYALIFLSPISHKVSILSFPESSIPLD